MIWSSIKNLFILYFPRFVDVPFAVNSEGGDFYIVAPLSYVWDDRDAYTHVCDGSAFVFGGYLWFARAQVDFLIEANHFWRLNQDLLDGLTSSSQKS